MRDDKSGNGLDWHGLGIIRGRAFLVETGYTETLCPTWAVIGILLLPTGVWAVFWHGQRVRAGHCAGCGYDLRATPDRCPECGLSKTMNDE